MVRLNQSFPSQCEGDFKGAPKLAAAEACVQHITGNSADKLASFFASFAGASGASATDGIALLCSAHLLMLSS